MSTPIAGVRYAYNATAKTWDSFGRPSLPATTDPPPSSSGWTPASLGFIDRPTGTGFVRIEDLGVSIDGAGIRAAVVKPAAAGKVLTLPAGTFEFDGYAQGDGGKFMHGVMINHDVNANQAIGIVGSGAGTIIRMKAGSSQFADNTAAVSGPTTPNGGLCFLSTIRFLNFPKVEVGNFTLQGADFPHWFNGIVISGATTSAYVHHIKAVGAFKGDFNSPPGETNAIATTGCKNVRYEDIEVDGRLGGRPWGSTGIGVNTTTDTTMKRIWVHDLLSGFGCAWYKSTNLYTEDFWTERPGTFAGGYNGAGFNHELSSGVVSHVRPHILLDAFWGITDHPSTGRRRVGRSWLGTADSYINNPAALANLSGGMVDDVGKFGHLTVWNSASTAASTYDMTITDPVFDSWGGIKKGFAITADACLSRPKVIINGVTLVPVTRPKEREDNPAIDPTKQYWVTAVAGAGSVWG